MLPSSTGCGAFLALQAGQEDEAIAHFRKVKDPITPGDNPRAWPVYARQRQGEWQGASSLLNQFRNGFSARLDASPDPFLDWLGLHQSVKTGRLMRSPFEQRAGLGKTPAVEILELATLLEQGRIYDAGHAFLNLESSTQSSRVELVALRRPLMMAAGEQSLKDGEPGCAIEFWEAIAADLPLDSPLNFQLHINLIRAYRQGNADAEALKPIRRLVRWLEQSAKASDGSPAQGWSEARRKSALIHLHCFAADAQMSSGARTPALQAIKAAEQLDPDHAEVLARRGLATLLDRKFEAAIALLTTALEKGCTFSEAYSALLQALDQTKDKAAKADARRRFGKRFGDLVEAGMEEELPRWIEAIATQSFEILSR
ncbi:MAG: hypothetical protein HC824_19105 [Synechococcales cyanobacterium RM1_1_8]|nr:hypothetical protein [Synechococcales cyanobacterium RM1_1_8]